MRRSVASGLYERQRRELCRRNLLHPHQHFNYGGMIIKPIFPLQPLRVILYLCSHYTCVFIYHHLDI
jgi:hypothetical protein